ncbi:MFS general substrate transporter [Wallemia mellicola]|nr:MFS general substrate transporter [Wallemia mellicola]
MATESTPLMANDFVQDSMVHTVAYDPESDTDKKSLDDKLEDVPPLSRDPVQRTGILSLFQRKKDKTDPNNIATQPSVFDTADAKYFEPSPEYENKHRFDPLFRWTWGEQTEVTRKADFRILPWCMLLFFALDIDRSNITNATADNFLDDLGLSQSDYNLGQTLSKIGFLVAELPSQLVSKRVGPDRWIPTQIVIFSIISGAQFWLRGRTSFFATRFLIAFFQGGFIPDTILYLSYYYTKTELPIRIALFYTINPIADLVTAFLSVGLLEMRGILGYEGWRWMYLIEALITLVIGIAAFFYLPAGPTQTKIFNEKEEKIITNKILRDDPGKASMHNRQLLTPRMLLKSLLDWDQFPLLLLGFTFNLPSYPVKNYLQQSFKSLGFSTVMSNLLTIPYIAVSIITVVAAACLSELVDDRGFISTIQQIWMLPCFVALLVLKSPGPWSYFAISTVLLGYPNVQPIMISWCSANSGDVSNRTVSASLFNMFVQVSAIAGSNVYQKDDVNYTKANSGLIGVLCVNILLFPATKLYYHLRNRYKEKKWSELTVDERIEYIRTTKDKANKRLDFRFVH